jgi:hypothetical protein
LRVCANTGPQLEGYIEVDRVLDKKEKTMKKYILKK